MTPVTYDYLKLAFEVEQIHGPRWRIIDGPGDPQGTKDMIGRIAIIPYQNDVMTVNYPIKGTIHHTTRYFVEYKDILMLEREDGEG